MADRKLMYSLSISARLQLNMHDLNNEGGEGNQTLTRYVAILDSKGQIAQVNAVSGDMLKHVQSEYLWKLGQENNLDLCEGCKNFSANRVSGDEEFIKRINAKDKKLKDEEVINEMINKCIIDDLNGILITNGGRNTPRKSVVEFGWLIAIPEKNASENYFHAKFAPDAAAKKEEAQQDGEQGEDKTKSNQGQNIFYRPANSGEYALVLNLDIFRIGFNDIIKTYPDEGRRQKRFEALLKSVMFTLTNLKGAMRNTQNPHLTKMSGIIAISKNSFPAPLISPLEDNYKEQIENIGLTLEGIGGQIETIKFETVEGFVSQMSEIIKNYVPYKI